MLKINVRPDVDFANLVRAFKKYPEKVTPFLRNAADEIAFLIEGESKERAPVDRGRLRGSIGVSNGLPPGIRAIVSTNVDYAAAVHEGRKPGTMPPIEEIRDWVKRKGIAASPYAIAMRIKQKGTKARPFMQEAVDENEDKISEIFKYWVTKSVNLLKE